MTDEIKDDSEYRPPPKPKNYDDKLKWAGTLDDNNEPFDPEKHCVNKEGLPKKKKDGTWMVAAGGRPSGYPKSGGKDKGTKHKKTLKISEMIKAALEEQGGVDYLSWLARRYPPQFVQLVAHVARLQETSNEEEKNKIVPVPVVAAPADFEKRLAEIQKLKDQQQEEDEEQDDEDE